MVPATEEERQGRAYDIGEDVVGVEVAAVGEKGLDDFGADAEAGGAGQEGKVNDFAAGEFEDPVEGELVGVLERICHVASSGQI